MNGLTIGPTDARWDAVLDELEADLDRIETALDDLDGEDPDPAWPRLRWQPPAGLGPLPQRLEARAVALRDRLADTQDELQAARDDALAQVRTTRTRRDAANAYHRTG